MCLPAPKPPVRMVRGLSRTSTYDYIPVKGEIEIFENRNFQVISKEDIIEHDYEKMSKCPKIRDHDNTAELAEIARGMVTMKYVGDPPIARPLTESNFYKELSNPFPRKDEWIEVPMTVDELRRRLYSLVEDYRPPSNTTI